jgi:FkbM family methyltransferase
MIGLTKRFTKNVLARLGYEIKKSGELGSNPMQDMLRLTRLSGISRPVVFDIGANVGNTVREFHATFGKVVIHAFEPSPEIFEILKETTSHIPALALNKFGLGSRSTELGFHKSIQSEMSSFLEPARDCWAEPDRIQTLPVRTIDDYCLEHSIDKIDVLKSDTQGYDLEVFRGAKRMLASGGVRLVYVEIIFSEMYCGAARLDEIYKHLCDQGFQLVTFYRFYYQHYRAGWTDALFAYGR